MNRLPAYKSLPPSVYFHRDDPRDTQIILQVPNAAKTDSETYLLDLEEGECRGWLEGLPNSGRLRSFLDGAQHVAFHTQSGAVFEIDDLDASGPMEQFVKAARAAQQPGPRQRLWDRIAPLFHRGNLRAGPR